MNKLFTLRMIDIWMSKKIRIGIFLFDMCISNRCLSLNVLECAIILFSDIYLYELYTSFRCGKFIPEVCSSALVTLRIPRSFHLHNIAIGGQMPPRLWQLNEIPLERSNSVGRFFRRTFSSALKIVEPPPLRNRKSFLSSGSNLYFSFSREERKSFVLKMAQTGLQRLFKSVSSSPSSRHDSEMRSIPASVLAEG